MMAATVAPAAAAATTSASASPTSSSSGIPPHHQPHFSLADCTADLLSIVVSYLGPRDRAAFSGACSFHLIVGRMVAERGATWGTVQQVNDPTAAATAAPGAAGGGGTSKPPPFGLGYVDRPRFLQPGERGETVALVSYPRSGNSMLRGLLERVTGVVTGSDTRPDRVLSRSLLRKGLRGEGVVDDRAWVVKTHWPERYGYRRFPAHRVILLVRNPFDAINSYFNMALTNTHDQTLTDEVYATLAGEWDELLRNEVQVWARFNVHWLSRGLPLLAIRYEDLLLHPEEMLCRLLAFLENLTPEAVRASPVYMARVRAAAAAVGGRRGGKEESKKEEEKGVGPSTAAAGQPPAAAAAAAAATPTDGNSGGGGGDGRVSDPLNANRPRSGGRIGGAMRFYSPEQVKAMCELEGAALRAFGYDPATQNFPQAMLSLPPYERCVKFLDKAAAPPSPPPAAAVPPAASTPEPGLPPAAGTVVNKGRQLRPPSDKWGRNITKFRHSLTEDDRRPLPTVRK